jgi:hypothetical protein
MTFKSFLSVLIGAVVSVFVSFLGFIAYSINELNVKLAVILERVAVYEKRLDVQDKRFEQHDKRIYALEMRRDSIIMSKKHRGEND